MRSICRKRRGGRFIRADRIASQDVVHVSEHKQRLEEQSLALRGLITGGKPSPIWLRVADGFELSATSGWAVMRGGSIRKIKLPLGHHEFPSKKGGDLVQYIEVPMIFTYKYAAEQLKQKGDSVKKVGLVEL